MRNRIACPHFRKYRDKKNCGPSTITPRSNPFKNMRCILLKITEVIYDWPLIKKEKICQLFIVLIYYTKARFLLRKMMEEFELNTKLCYIDKTPFAESDMEFTEEPLYYKRQGKECYIKSACATTHIRIGR